MYMEHSTALLDKQMIGSNNLPGNEILLLRTFSGRTDDSLSIFQWFRKLIFAERLNVTLSTPSAKCGLV